MEQLSGGSEFLFQVVDALAKGEMPRQFNKTDQVTAAAAAVAIEQVFLRVDVERGLGFLMQGTQSYELGAGADLMPSPMVPLQVLQQRNALFEPFQILAHGVHNPPSVRVGTLGCHSQARMVCEEKNVVLRGAGAKARRLGEKETR